MAIFPVLGSLTVARFALVSPAGKFRVDAVGLLVRVGVHREVAGRPRLGLGDVQHDGRGTRRGDAPATGHLGVDRRVRRHRAARPVAHPGVEDPGRIHRHERTRRGRRPREVVAGDVGDQVDRGVGGAREGEHAVVAQPHRDEVRPRVAPRVVQVGGRRSGRPVRIDGDVPALHGVRLGDVEHDGRRTCGRHASTTRDLHVDRRIRRDRTGGAVRDPGVEHPCRIQGDEGTRRRRHPGEEVPRHVGDQLNRGLVGVGQRHLAVAAELHRDEVGARVALREIEVRRRGPGRAVGIDGDVAAHRGVGFGDVEHHRRHPRRRDAAAARDLQVDRRIRRDGSGRAVGDPGVQNPGGGERHECPRKARRRRRHRAPPRDRSDHQHQRHDTRTGGCPAAPTQHEIPRPGLAARTPGDVAIPSKITHHGDPLRNWGIPVIDGAITHVQMGSGHRVRAGLPNSPGGHSRRCSTTPPMPGPLRWRGLGTPLPRAITRLRAWTRCCSV